MISPSPLDLWMEDDSIRKQVLTRISTSIVDEHIDLVTEFRDPPPADVSVSVGAVDADVGADENADEEAAGADQDEEAATGGSDQPETDDHSKGTVYDYTREVLSLGLLYLNFKDAVREGDGDRIRRMWKYFLPLLDTRIMHWKH